MSLSSSYLTVPAQRPQSSWPARSAFQALDDVADAEHLVQLYETEPYMIACVSRFLGASLRAGGGAFVVTTPAHREAIEAALDLEEICVGAASRRGQYVAVDAERTLDSLGADGNTNAAAFRHRVGKRLGELSRRWRHVRVFDETDAILWREGRHGDAAALEREWNAARRRHRFVRLSTYPTCGLSDDFARAAFARLCAGAVRVLPPQRSIGPGVLRALRAPRGAPPASTRLRGSRGRADATREAAAR